MHAVYIAPFFKLNDALKAEKKTKYKQHNTETNIVI